MSNTLENELATALASLKSFLLKRSWISISRKNSEIGVGGFGTVHRGVLQKGFLAPKTSIAIKKLFTLGDRTKRLRVALELVRELSVHSSLNHPNILPLVGFHLNTTLEEAWIVSPYAEKGNVYEYLERVNPPLDERLKIAKDTARGLHYLHTREPPICHGDIKALNVLVGADGTAMLCDFGLSKTNEGRSSVPTSNTGGTSRYWSPELFNPEAHPTTESDVWAWGCLFLEIITGQTPYGDTPLDGRVIYQIFVHVLPGRLDELGCPQHAKDILSQCWQIAPDARPSMGHVLGLLSAGNIHYIQESNPDPPPVDRTSQLDVLGRELSELLVTLQRLRIKPSRLVIPKEKSTIGVGGYGTVHKATMRQRSWGKSGILVAVKKLRAAGGQDKCLRMAIALIRELEVWGSLTHPNVIPLIGFHLSERLEEAWMVSPYLENGNIRDYLLQVRATSEQRTELALDTANGLAYLHNLDPPICHGDIKSLNVLITGQRRAVLCDFGLAKAMESMPSGLTTSTFNQGGSLPYESPELLVGSSGRTLRSDVWAWGCLLQEIFTDKAPYHWAINPGAMVKWIVQDIPPAAFDDLDCSDDVRNLLTYCWQSRPENRPTMAQCIAILSDSASSNPSNNATAILQELKETRSVGRATVIDRAKLQFDAGSKIGSGRFGTLFRATLLDDTTPPNTTLVAARRLLPASGDQHANRQHTEMVNKADKWSDLNNPNIAKFVGYYPSGPAVSREFLLVFSYVSGSHLVEYLERESPDYVRRINLATDVAQGLLYLHTRSPPIRHGNLHPRNILVESDGRALLCDYDLEGLAGEATEVNQQTMETLRYKSPEELRTIPKPVLRSDIWSFGSVFLTIITSQVPYGNVAIDKSKLIEVASQRIPPADIDNLGCPSRAQNVLGICWKWDPESRPPPNELVSILSGRLCRFTEVWNIPADGLLSLRFSQDGKYLAVGYGKSIKIYNAESGVLVFELGVPVAKLVAMQFSRSGRFLAVSTVDYTVALWDLATHDFKGELKGHTDIIWTLDMSFDDSCVVSGSYDRTIRVWVIDGQEIPTRTIPTDLEVECLTTHPNSHIMAVSLDEGGAQVRSLLTGQVLVALDPPDTTFALHFSPDGRSLYGGCYGGHMCHWDIGSILQQPPAENSSDKGSISYTALRQVKGVIVLEPIWVITTSSKWFVAIDGEGSVWALNLQPKGTTPQVIGKIDSVRPRDRAHLGPVSEDGKGLAISCPDRSRIMTVSKYESWDIPGIYRQ